MSSRSPEYWAKFFAETGEEPDESNWQKQVNALFNPWECSSSDDTSRNRGEAFHSKAPEQEAIVQARRHLRSKKPQRTANGMDRARDLLWSGLLNSAEKMVWEMYCDGAGEREIATTLGISRRALSRNYMQRLKGLAGMEVEDAYRYRSKRRVACR